MPACFRIQGRPYPMEKRPLSAGATAKVVQGDVKKTKVFFSHITCCLSRNCAKQCWQGRCKPDQHNVYTGIHYKNNGQHGFWPVLECTLTEVFSTTVHMMSLRSCSKNASTVLKACTTITRGAPTGEYDDCMQTSRLIMCLLSMYKYDLNCSFANFAQHSHARKGLCP